MLLLALGVALVVGAGALVASCLGLRSTIGFVLATYLLASGEVVVVSLGLSPVDALTRTALLVAFGGWFGLACVAWVARGRPRAPFVVLAPVREALRDRAVAVLAAVAVLTHGYALVVALTVPQSLPDTMLYHLPRAALWKQQHAVGHIPNAPDSRIDVFSPVAEIQASVSMILSRGDRYVALVQLLALLASCFAIAGIARRLGLARGAAAFGALAFASFTVVVLQTPTALNDLVVAAFLVVCAYFAMGSTRTELALAALALALAVGTKGTAAFAIPALALFVLSSQPRRRWWSLVALGAVGLAVGSFWFAVNLAEAGHATGVGVDRGVDPLGERIWRSVADLLELSDVDNTALLASPLWGLGALAIALVGALVLWRRSRVAAGVAVLVGAIAFLVAPMLVTWAQLAARAAAHAANAIGLDVGGPAGRLPEGFVESPMHSSYGLAFVILLFGAGALVVVDVARRQRPVATLAALCGLPVTLLVTALVLGYDSQRMRYLVFAVALAAAVFGIALRVRALAWTAVAATVVSAMVSAAYFIPRPAGLAVLPGNRSGEMSARWFVQAGGGGGDGAAFRFLEERIPADATVALDLVSNTYSYPAWDEGLRRTITFVPRDGTVPVDADWLVVGPSRTVDEARLEERGWNLELDSPRGWRIYGR